MSSYSLEASSIVLAYYDQGKGEYKRNEYAKYGPVTKEMESRFFVTGDGGVILTFWSANPGLVKHNTRDMKADSAIYTYRV
jgi:hypothetical protein